MKKFKPWLKTLIQFRVTERRWAGLGAGNSTWHHVAVMNDEFKELSHYGQEKTMCLLPSILFSMAFDLLLNVDKRVGLLASSPAEV